MITQSSRRQFLTTTAAGLTGALAGCVSDFGGGGDGQDAPYIVMVDTVWGHENAPEGKVCAPSNTFEHNQMIVFLIEVIDPETGDTVTDDTLESVEVQIPDGPALPAEYGPHPEDDPVDHFWAVSWVVEPEYSAGTVDFTVEVEDGRSATQPSFGTQQLTIAESGE